MRTEILLSGTGGQGLLMAGVLLGEAAVVYGGKNATQNQTYGVQARGGESASEVIISDEDISYAEIDQADVLVALAQSALNAYAPRIREGAVVIVDSSLVTDTAPVTKTDRIYAFPITNIAMDATGRAILANVVSLGVVAALTGVVDCDALRREVARRAPAGTEEMNLRALAGGIDAVQAMQGGAAV